MNHQRTAVEKMVAAHLVEWGSACLPRAGDFVMLRPHHVMTHDNTSAVLPKFRAMVGEGAHIHDPDQPIFAIDHDIQNHSSANLGKYARIRSFAAGEGVRYFPPGRGIGHQIMIDEGFVVPGSLVVASDSHANMYGALNALGTPVVRTDAAALWATGVMWWTVPAQVRVTLSNSLEHGVTGKDVILSLCSVFCNEQVCNTAVEFAGDGIGSLSIDDRLTIANMTTEWGAIVGLFPFDEVLRDWLYGRAQRLGIRRAQIDALWDRRHDFTTDQDAFFTREITLDLSTVRPHISGPNSVTTRVEIEQAGTDPVSINKAYLMSCVNGRLADIESAAKVFAGGRCVRDGVEFYLAAASSKIEEQARASGSWQTLLNAGAIALPAGCGACIGLGRGTLQAGEVGISATNRNFDGRMGHRDSVCYLASPAVVAESAIQGRLALPTMRTGAFLKTGQHFNPSPASPVRGSESIVDGFAACISGRTLILPCDHLNTDQIYGKDVTYQDHLTLIEQSAHAMRHYDPGFVSIVRPGDILISGANFGCGSSREQAVTALIGAGVSLILAKSVSQTYQRNALNNGIIALECPDFSCDMISYAQMDQAGARTAIGPEVVINFDSSSIQALGRSYSFPPLNDIAQRLIVAGGLVPMVRRRIAVERGVLE
jgi:homoaconitate hydratase